MAATEPPEGFKDFFVGKKTEAYQSDGRFDKTRAKGRAERDYENLLELFQIDPDADEVQQWLKKFEEATDGGGSSGKKTSKKTGGKRKKEDEEEPKPKASKKKPAKASEGDEDAEAEAKPKAKRVKKETSEQQVFKPVKTIRLEYYKEYDQKRKCDLWVSKKNPEEVHMTCPASYYAAVYGDAASECHSISKKKRSRAGASTARKGQLHGYQLYMVESQHTGSNGNDKIRLSAQYWTNEMTEKEKDAYKQRAKELNQYRLGWLYFSEEKNEKGEKRGWNPAMKKEWVKMSDSEHKKYNELAIKANGGSGDGTTAVADVKADKDVDEWGTL